MEKYLSQSPKYVELQFYSRYYLTGATLGWAKWNHNLFRDFRVKLKLFRIIEYSLIAHKTNKKKKL